MRNFDFMEILLAILTLMLIAAILVTIMALTYPDVTSSIVADIRQGVSEGRSPVLVSILTVTKRMSEGLNYRIKPFVRRAGRVLAKVQLPKLPKARVDKSFKPKDCNSGCHAKLFDQAAVANIYVEHRLHEALEVACATCHVDIGHPKPEPVKKNICIDCHKAEKVSTSCDTCHPPGSILAKKVIPETKTKEFLAGRTTTSKTLVKRDFAIPDPQWLKTDVSEEHGAEGPCHNCHQVPEFCSSCHLVFHDKLPDWRSSHGPRILRREYVPNACWTCHNPNWCSDTCHAGVNKNQRKRAFKPAPSLPLKDYLRRL